jgi:hypothetical protein
VGVYLFDYYVPWWVLGVGAFIVTLVAVLLWRVPGDRVER